MVEKPLKGSRDKAREEQSKFNLKALTSFCSWLYFVSGSREHRHQIDNLTKKTKTIVWDPLAETQGGRVYQVAVKVPVWNKRFRIKVEGRSLGWEVDYNG